MSKQYGLILAGKKGSGKTPLTFNATRNVFGENSGSDSDDQTPKAPVYSGDKIKRQARIAQENAVKEDPTVYQYDELYDDIENTKKEKTLLKKESREPKYIKKLLETADKRKKENERRVERQVQKEREEEGDKFNDKESFVTSGYKKKLEEMKLEEEKDQREQYLEAIGDVTKQCDLGGFYRHLYDQQLKSKDPVPDVTPIVKEEKQDVSPPPKDSQSDQIDESNKKSKSKRSYRKRKVSANNNDASDKSDSENEEGSSSVRDIKTTKKQKTHLTSNIDADSDFSIDESSSDGEGEEKEKVVDNSDKVEDELVEVKKESEESAPKPDSEFKKPFDVDQDVKTKKSPEKEIVEEEIKPKIDIWKKRTVGVVFEEALQRYYERKSRRL